MERFSISIICQQVYNICRLCGVDNPDKIPIIGAEAEIFITESDEPTLVKKIEQCVGIKVDLLDQMPQQICSLCVDKVNDFFEYRSMCEAINIQTRRFLNLPLVQPPIPTSKPIKVENVVIALDDDDDEVDTKPIDKRGPKTRNRKKQPEKDVPGSGEEVDSKSFLEGPSEKRFKYDHPCQYCNESYSQSSDLERHLVVKHTPLVHKFGCGSCMEYFDTATEYKDHNLWHKLTRTSFGCVRCNRKFVKISTLNKHVSLNACIRRPYVSYEVTLVPDMQCSLCFKVFKTRNLYEWHGCFLRSRANCPKCGKHFLKKNLLIRHYMLYCNGTNPLLEPIVIPKDEPGPGTVNNIPHVGTEKRKRGRPSAARAAADMKEETIDLPFPALLDLPDPKSETNSIADGHMSPVEGTVSSGNEMVESQRRSSLMEETKKITTLLRSGESVDGNTDINTINSMLSSVNEAIATISKVRKKKKKRDRLSSSGAGNVSEGTETSNPPMVVLSMANVKQEVQENSVPLAPTDSAGMVNGLSEAVRGGNVDQRGVDSSASNSLADRNHNAGDSDSDVEIISVEQYQAVNSETIPVDANGDDTMGGNNTRSHETDVGSEPMIQVKREPLAIDDEDESDFEGYEDASMYVAVKQEPVEEETVEPVSFDQHSAAAEKQSEPSFSSFQALRIKIKKEKGLLNASVVGEDGSTDTASTLEENSSNDKRQTGAVVREKKTPKDKSAKRGSNPPPVKRCLRTSTMSVSIKQEPRDNEEQPLERVTEPEQPYQAEGNEVFDATVRVKQEPQEEDTRPSDEDDEQMHSADQVAFDGMRIKRERPDDEPASHKRHASSKAINPLSLTGVRIAGGHKKTANSQPGVSAHKSSKMINPFALLKQKESVSSVAEQESGSRNSEPAAAGPSEGFGLPVITQVQSIDPVEHLSLTQVDAVAAESTNEALEQQKETTAEMVDTDNGSHMDSVPPSEPPCNSESLAMDTNNVPSEEDVGELRITSVTTIPEDSVSSQENSTLREPNIATITPQDSSSELKIASVTTIPPPESSS
uniref:ZAD domain-containing protein n=1 Tax=Anopheles culicifacies TaxID=139723 RepID=A0A182LSI9_9DIPT